MQERFGDFRDLIVWQRAIDLAKATYSVTRHFPNDERFGLISQIRRASVSASSNIAEGHARTDREFRSFLSIARGSATEVQSQLLLSVELGFVAHSEIIEAMSLCEEVRRMTATMIKQLRDQ